MLIYTSYFFRRKHSAPIGHWSEPGLKKIGGGVGFFKGF